ncbi:MAG: ABC transporter permease [Chitinophagales bacterium]
MLQNYFKTAFRNLIRNKIFSLINILGLAIGMTCCFLIVLFVKDELSYDQFQEKFERIYRVKYLPKFSGSGMELARTPPPLSPLLTDYFPEIEQSARFYLRSASIEVPAINGEENKQYEEDRVFFADSTLTDVFTFQFTKGNPQTALDAPFSVVIAESIAEKYFGDENPMGKTILMSGQYAFNVTGVFEDYPDNSHVHFEIVAPFQNMFSIEPEAIRENMKTNLAQNWVISHLYTYVLLKPNQSPESVDTKMPQLIDTYASEAVKGKEDFVLQPLKDIHLRSGIGLEVEAVGNMRHIYLFGIIALLTLLIACINFVNLSTAASLKRATEVGIRKVVGANKANLVGQFLSESLLLSFFAFVVSLLLFEFSLPILNALTDKTLEFNLLQDWGLSLVFVSIFLASGLLAGAYPAFFVTRFQAASILKGTGYRSIPKGAVLRKALITTQFFVSIALIAATLVVYQQWQYMRNQPMGFAQNQMLTVRLFSENMNSIFGGVTGELRGKMNAFEESLQENPNILGSTLSAALPGMGSLRRNVSTDSIKVEDNLYMGVIAVDYDFPNVYDLEFIEGRTFDKSFGTDHLNAFVINEKAIPILGWESPATAIGQPMVMEGKTGTVVGVVKDFHSTDLTSSIEGLILHVDAGTFTTFSIRMQNAEIPQTVDFIRQKWGGFFPEKVMDYAFLDDQIETLYVTESRLSKIIGYFSFLAILISCFGLYGLVMYAALQKAKEIGIRKVLGASVPNILTLLSKDFLQLIALASVLAIPLVFYGMSQWLEDYAYRIDLSWWLFALPVAAVLLIAMTTLSFQTVQSALANPVEALRNE